MRIQKKLLPKKYRDLIKEAIKVRENAYEPYSKYKVGAAVLTKKGNIYVGCNVEAIGYTLTTHAEGNALDTMVSNGEYEIKALAVVTEDEPMAPCGLCREKIYNFADRNVTILASNLEGLVEVSTLGELIPKHFIKDVKRWKPLLKENEYD